MKYAFVLGREPALSTAEILSLLKSRGVGFDPKDCLFSNSILMVETEAELGPEFFHDLGGSIKIAEVLGASTQLEENLFEALESLGRESLDFGLSLYPLEAVLSGGYKSLLYGLRPLALTMKKRLKESGKSVRVVLPDGPALTAVQVDKNRLIEKGAELLILVGQGTVWIARTLAVQAFEEFSGRDFGRPGRDAKSGMLPPKLARMMINLSGAPENGTLSDPFCGSGTVLSEAALLGYRKLIGSDISEKAVTDTQTNFDWTLQHEPELKPKFEVFKSDVKFLPEKLKPASVDAIVSEPFLGPPLRGDESDQKVHFIYLELMGLYRRAFEAFAKVLKPGAPVVFVFPVFASKHVNILRDIEALGFRAEALLPGKAVTDLGVKSSTGLLYKRPDQKVGREIFRFRFGGKA
jgi:tRNA G10  N-methylase Trm11